MPGSFANALRRGLCLALVVALAGVSTPAFARRAKDGDGKRKPARVLGTVKDTGGTPLAGVAVALVPLEARGDRPLRTVSGQDGGFRFADVPYGVYEIGFEGNGKAFAANRTLLVAPGRKLEVSFRLGEFEARDKAAGLESGVRVAGVVSPAAGIARLEERTTPTGLAWLRTGKGVAVVVGTGALVVAGLIAATGGDGSN